MREADRAALRRLVFELTSGGRDLAQLPANKTALAGRLRELG